MAQVTLEGVTKYFPTSGPRRKRHATAAVKSLHLEVRDEEFLVLVGPSGCGKSTTLRIIAGLETADEGTVRIGERVVNAVAPKDRNIAMVFQNYALYPHMTVYRNMAFGLELRAGGNVVSRLFRSLAAPAKAKEVGIKRRAIENRVRETARTLGIEPLLDRLPGQLSGGERQRVALGRAIVRQPEAFLFDEPLSNLDAQLRVEMRRELKELHERLRATMIYVTHDQVEALTLGDRIVVMHRGEIQQVGTPEEVYDRPRNRFVAGFIGSPSMNLLAGALSSTDDGIQFQSPGVTVSLDPALLTRGATSAASFPSAVDPPDAGRDVLEKILVSQAGRPVVLGVRPEDVRLAAAGDDSAAPGARAGRARVTVVESLGDASLVHLAWDGAESDGMAWEREGRASAPAMTTTSASTPDSARPLVCKTAARTPLRRGDGVEVRFDLSRIHLFDEQTGESLAAQPLAHEFTV